MDNSANTKKRKAGRTCFVPGCTSGYKSNKNKVTLFSTPKDKNRFEKWQKIISRADKELDQYSVVCELHFDERFIERNYKYIIEGKEVSLLRTRPSLTADAFPSIFPNPPNYITKKLSPTVSPKIRDSFPTRPKKRNEYFECNFTTTPAASDNVECSSNVDLAKVLDSVPLPSKWCKTSKPSPLQQTDDPDWAPSLNLGYEKVGNVTATVERVYQKTVKKTAMKTSSATNTIEQGYKSKDLPLTSIQSGNLPLSNINLVMLAKNTTSDCRFTTENIIPTAVASRSILKKNVKSTDNSWDSSNLDSAMNHTEFMNCNFNESEQIDCVTHEEAFCAAKTLLHYMINQDDVNNEDINFILNLTKKIESKLSIKKKTSS